VIGATGSVAQHSAQNKAAAANKREALRAQREASKDISLLQVQQQDATARTIYEADRSARSSQALARVSAGEAGVAGASVEALLGDIDRQLGEFQSTEQRNLDMALDQLQREKISGRQVAQSRIAAVPRGNNLALGISLAGAGLEFWAGQINRQPPDNT
jgi:hypothetical protein